MFRTLSIYPSLSISYSMFPKVETLTAHNTLLAQLRFAGPLAPASVSVMLSCFGTKVLAQCSCAQNLKFTHIFPDATVPALFHQGLSCVYFPLTHVAHVVHYLGQLVGHQRNGTGRAPLLGLCFPLL